MIEDFRTAVIEVLKSFNKAEDSAEDLILAVDDGGVSIVSPNKLPVLNLNQCPYLEVGVVSLNSEDAIGQYEVELSLNVSLWTKGWELTLGDRFLSLLATTGLRTLRRPPYSYKVSLSGHSPERKFQMSPESKEPGPPVTETTATLKTKLCFTT